MTSPVEIIREDIQAMSAYSVPFSAGMVKLDAMENPYLLPAHVRREVAAATASAEINRYPDPRASALKMRLRGVMAVPEQFDILLGNGSDEILQMMVQACAVPGTCIMAPSPTFAMYRQYTVVAGLKYIGVPLRPDFSIDRDVFCAAMAEHLPAIVFISYPNNPTGNSFNRDDLTYIITRSPGLVVIDEAYRPFAEDSFLDDLNRFSNLVVLRTLSKLGLAGLRLGFAVGRREWMQEFDKVRSPYNVNVLTQLVAEKVLCHYSVLEEQAGWICSERTRLAAALSAMPGVLPFPSQANFILARVADAPQVCEALRERKILIKNMHGMHSLLEQCVRFTVGTNRENTQLISALHDALATQLNGD